MANSFQNSQAQAQRLPPDTSRQLHREGQGHSVLNTFPKVEDCLCQILEVNVRYTHDIRIFFSPPHYEAEVTSSLDVWLLSPESTSQRPVEKFLSLLFKRKQILSYRRDTMRISYVQKALTASPMGL